MNVTYAGIELRRVLRDYVSMFFIALLPAFFYVVFGAAQDFSAQRAGNGNVAMYIMISMAAYGAVTATTGVGGMAAVERAQGWGRQLGLTPLADHAYVAVKAFVAVVVAAVPIALIYLVGVLTGAEGEALAWVLSALVVLLGASVFALYGLVMGLAFRTEAAVSAASGLLVIMGSGETSPTMSKVHRDLLDRVGPGPAVMLDTPFGFQENADDISSKALASSGEINFTGWAGFDGPLAAPSAVASRENSVRRPGGRCVNSRRAMR